jgi:hypothetical protein
VARLWSSDRHTAAIVARKRDVCGSSKIQTQNGVWLNCLVSVSRSVSVGGGRLMRLLVIGCL